MKSKSKLFKNCNLKVRSLNIRRISYAYMNKLNNSMRDGDPNEKKFAQFAKAFRKYFRSKKGKRHLRICLVAFGFIGMYAILKHKFDIESIKNIGRLKFFSKTTDSNPFSVPDQNFDKNDLLEKTSQNNGKWKPIASLLVVGGLLITAFIFASNKEKVVIEVEPEQLIWNMDKKTFDDLIRLLGVVMVFSSVPALTIYPPLSPFLMGTGWQMATWPRNT